MALASNAARRRSHKTSVAALTPKAAATRRPRMRATVRQTMLTTEALRARRAKCKSCGSSSSSESLVGMRVLWPEAGRSSSSSTVHCLGGGNDGASQSSTTTCGRRVGRATRAGKLRRTSISQSSSLSSMQVAMHEVRHDGGSGGRRALDGHRARRVPAEFERGIRARGAWSVLYGLQGDDADEKESDPRW